LVSSLNSDFIRRQGYHRMLRAGLLIVIKVHYKGEKPRKIERAKMAK
jgi:hypothetical protein